MYIVESILYILFGLDNILQEVYCIFCSVQGSVDGTPDVRLSLPNKETTKGTDWDYMDRDEDDNDDHDDDGDYDDDDV